MSDDLALCVLKSRGLGESDATDFIDPDFGHSLHDPFLLPDMGKAVERLGLAIKKNQSIVIYGDYDIDGLTASSLLLDGLKSFGANVSVYIPDRFEEGYGINSQALEKIKSKGADLVITVDCGITSEREIAQASLDGLDIIVTDHHNPPEKLPARAVALVNPKLPSSKYPFNELAGVGVAYKLILALQSVLPNGLEKGQEKWLLDLVALGTVCDVVPLIDENRTLVLFGLKVLAKSRRTGLRALAEMTGVDLARIKSGDIGFRLGPRLNAAGRLTHANKALQLLITNQASEAKELALELEQLNVIRQQNTAKIYQEASQLAKKYSKDTVLVLADESWSHGVAGIAASRIAEKFAKPTIILQKQAETAKGSARSVGSFDIIKAISSSSKLLEKFGGHQFAAGLTIKLENLDEFKTQINQYAKKVIHDSDLITTIEIDLLLDGDRLSIESAQQLRRLEPYGNKNREPIVESQLTLKSFKLIGVDLKHVKLEFVSPGGSQLSGIAFSAADKWSWLKADCLVKALYHLNVNQWRNIASVQLEVIDMVESADSSNART